jgi:predicted 3-demethylubiquinone-9 3-methyltransferase (glyoxalase superfamily)
MQTTGMEEGGVEQSIPFALQRHVNHYTVQIWSKGSTHPATLNVRNVVEVNTVLVDPCVWMGDKVGMQCQITPKKLRKVGWL